MNNYRLFISLFLLSAGQCSMGTLCAQEQKSVTVTGSIQSDMLVPQNDERTGALKDEAFQANL